MRNVFFGNEKLFAVFTAVFLFAVIFVFFPQRAVADVVCAQGSKDIEACEIFCRDKKKPLIYLNGDFAVNCENLSISSIVNNCVCADKANDLVLGQQVSPENKSKAKEIIRQSVRFTTQAQSFIDRCSDEQALKQNTNYCFIIHDGNLNNTTCKGFYVSSSNNSNKEDSDATAETNEYKKISGCTSENVKNMTAVRGKTRFIGVPASIDTDLCAAKFTEISQGANDQITDNSTAGFMWKSVTYGCWKCGDCQIADLVRMVKNFIDGLVAIVGALALTFFIYGAVELVLSRGNSEMVQKGRTIMTQTIVALFFVVASFLLVHFLIYAISGGSINTVNIFGSSWYVLGVQ